MTLATATSWLFWVNVGLFVLVDVVLGFLARRSRRGEPGAKLWWGLEPGSWLAAPAARRSAQAGEPLLWRMAPVLGHVRMALALAYVVVFLCYLSTARWPFFAWMLQVLDAMLPLG